MKKLTNNEAELKKSVAYKKKHVLCVNTIRKLIKNHKIMTGHQLYENNTFT